jgi:hypothetical protein
MLHQTQGGSTNRKRALEQLVLAYPDRVDPYL